MWESAVVFKILLLKISFIFLKKHIKRAIHFVTKSFKKMCFFQTCGKKAFFLLTRNPSSDAQDCRVYPRILSPCEWRENLKMRKTRKTRRVTKAPET